MTKAKLIIDIQYKDVDDDDIKHALHYAAQHLADNGLLSAEYGEIEGWSSKVELEDKT